MAYRHVVRNPRLQSRIFLTNWYMKVVRPGRELPPNVVQLHVPLDMSKIDVKNYLKAIYQVPVVQVHTRIQLGKYRQIIDNGWRKRKKFPDYKVAYVYLGEGQKFKFPDLFLPLEEELPKKEDESEVETTAKEKKISKVKEEDSPEEETEEEEEESKRWF